MSNQRPTQAVFRLECEMVDPARVWLTSQGLMAKTEFYTPWGVCDLVGVSLEPKRVQERLNLGQKEPIGPLLRVEILARIPDAVEGRGVTIERLESLYENLLAPDQLRAELERLKTRGFVQVDRRGALQRLNGWAPLHDRIVALELKLGRVDDALAQATSHLAFAEESFVGFPSGLAERVVNSNRVGEFRKAGVGVVSVRADRCTVLFPSKPSSGLANPVMQMHCVERFWRTRARDN